MTDFAPAEWLSLLHATTLQHTVSADSDPLARHLGSYRCLLESWGQALDAGRADPANTALDALAAYAQGECSRQLRALLSPGPAWDLLACLSLPSVALPVSAGLLTGIAAQGLMLWRALLDYQKQVERFCALYEHLGAQTLARLETLLDRTTDPPVDTVIALHGLWQHCQDACEAAIVRAETYAECLAALASAAAALQAAHRDWLAQCPGMATDPAVQRALSDELAAIRRQLRSMAGRSGDAL